MPIDPEFTRNQQVIGRHDHGHGQHYHFVWEPRSISNTSTNKDVRVDYAARNEDLVPVSVHGGVDWEYILGLQRLRSNMYLHYIYHLSLLLILTKGA
ncbi:MAG: hypothetical protein WAK17_02750 [Candidatus Nitrosopolaris sp.]|jgi:hypothetical protein